MTFDSGITFCFLNIFTFWTHTTVFGPFVIVFYCLLYTDLDHYMSLDLKFLYYFLVFRPLKAFNLLYLALYMFLNHYTYFLRKNISDFDHYMSLDRGLDLKFS